MDEQAEARRLTQLMHESMGSPWVQIRNWLQAEGFPSNECVIVTMFPEESGWECIVLLPDGRVLRLDPTHGTEGDISRQRAETTIAYSAYLDQAHQQMYAAELAAARFIAEKG